MAVTTKAFDNSYDYSQNSWWGGRPPPKQLTCVAGYCSKAVLRVTKSPSSLFGSSQTLLLVTLRVAGHPWATLGLATLE